MCLSGSRVHPGNKFPFELLSCIKSRQKALLRNSRHVKNMCPRHGSGMLASVPYAEHVPGAGGEGAFLTLGLTGKRCGGAQGIFDNKALEVRLTCNRAGKLDVATMPGMPEDSGICLSASNKSTARQRGLRARPRSSGRPCILACTLQTAKLSGVCVCVCV